MIVGRLRQGAAPPARLGRDPKPGPVQEQQSLSRRGWALVTAAGLPDSGEERQGLKKPRCAGRPCPQPVDWAMMVPCSPHWSGDGAESMRP
ncbi:hypothetical protein NDU88_004722 [Pleurodeles waltl]|uniref:Uncharacterized protein n=1 Tax=Pleurodeles waltl TaxID=8319 RepID=A0AAV7PEW1_PLEWA|nr:hypothetical protein NDU88_004722 [Pleurodeles waltl]